VPPLPDDRDELMTMERETLGLFLSSHPLKEVRPALRARVDCALTDLRDRPDKDRVNVGGMIADFKRIRTKRGDQMLFATLDDLEGQVELLVMGKAYEACSEWFDTGSVVFVSGRLDHKERGETKLVVQEIERFEPSAVDVARARKQQLGPSPVERLLLTVDAAVAETFIDELKDVVSHFPGERELALQIGERTLVLGPDYRVSASSACQADLAALPGTTALAA